MPILRCLPALFLLAAAAPAAACVGDCSGDEAVTVDELVLGVSAALGTVTIDECLIFDRDGSGDITVDELLEAVNNALAGCPPEATRTATPSVSPTPTIEPTATASPTRAVNLPPVAPTPMVYHGFAEHEIELPIGAVDPEGSALVYVAEDLPAGASLDPATGVFRWVPAPEQYGSWYVPWHAADDRSPAGEAAGRLTFEIEPADACSIVECDPATGCDSTLIPVTELCCDEVTPVHVAPPEAGCPEGLQLLVGANRSGFGALSNCDWFQVVNRAQSGADISLHVATRCLSTAFRATVRARLDMERPGQGPQVLVDDQVRVDLTPQDNGYAVRRGLRFAVDVPGPFFDFQNAEANLYVEVSQGDQIVSENLRLRLTFTPLPDLLDPTPAATPTALPQLP